MNPYFVSLALGLAVAALGGALVAKALRQPQVDAEAALAALEVAPPPVDGFAAQLKEPIATRLLAPLAAALAEKISGLLPNRRAEQLRHRLLVAGVSATLGPEEFVVLQGLGCGAGVLFGLVLAGWSGYADLGLLRLVAISGAAGALAPVAWLRRRQTERQGSIRRDLPDVLDLLTISMEAGVAFEGAVEVVTRHFHTPLGDELTRMLHEMELGLPRREALQNLKRRTEVPELSNVVLILVQADALGMPIARVLQTQATEMRLKRRQWARERAARLPVKILLPLTAFILPALFVVILGPAAMSVAHAF
jgi:tight adherence protein C